LTSRTKITMTAALAGFAVLPLTLQAHRQWLLPSSTVLSTSNGWVTVDAAVSNELFYFDHVPLRVTNLVVTAPDGTAAKVENAATGKYRTTFDLQLSQQGTYRIAIVNNTVFASWNENGSPKNWRGTAEAFAREVPAKAEGLKVSKMNGRVETFVTSGKALEPTGTGLELVPVTHPNDLVAGEPASFKLVLNGKPAAGLEVSVVPGGIRYRDQLQDMKCKTDAEGKFTVTFKAPGMHWINATTGGGPGGGGPGRGVPAGDRASYTATLEVMPQ
jgi:uncharacterized GH25 family protein